MCRIGQRGAEGRGDLWKCLRLRGASASEPRTIAAAPAGSSSCRPWHATACWLFSQQNHPRRARYGIASQSCLDDRFWFSALTTGQAASLDQERKDYQRGNRSCLLYGDDAPILYSGDAPIATPPVSPSGSTKYGRRPSMVHQYRLSGGQM